MYSDAFPAVSPYAAGKLKFLFFEGKDKQTKAIPKKTAGKASKKTEARQSTVYAILFFIYQLLFTFKNNQVNALSCSKASLA